MADLPSLLRTLLWTTLALSPGCDRPKCPDLTDVPCDFSGGAYCDACETVWFCGVDTAVTYNGRYVFYSEDAGCDCVQDKHLDTANPSCPAPD